MPGRRLAMEYRPSESVTASRVFSMRAGLAASTVTPGITPPLESLTTPAIEPEMPPWANNREGPTSSRAIRATLADRANRIVKLPIVFSLIAQGMRLCQEADLFGGRHSTAHGWASSIEC